jgi:hypothetical protein
LTKGYRATITGKIINAGTTPQTVGSLNVLNADVGCPNGMTTPTKITCASGGDKGAIVAHGTLMLLSWGLMLPSGVIAAKFLKHRTGGGSTTVPLWFRIHKILQPLGLVVALVGWIIALRNFQVLDEGGTTKQVMHVGLGMLTMILGLLQPLNAFFRPHKEKDDSVSAKRRCWEILHKGSGYLAVFAGLVTVGLGTVLAKEVDIPTFQYVYIVFLILLAAFLAVAWYDGHARTRVSHKEVVQRAM